MPPPSPGIKKLSKTVTRSALAAAVVAAFAIAAPGAASAGDWLGAFNDSNVKTNDALQALSGQDRTFNVEDGKDKFHQGLEADESNVASIIVDDGSALAAEKFSTNFTLKGFDDYQVVGHALRLNTGSSLTLTGSTADIAINVDGSTSTVHADNESAALMVKGSADSSKAAADQKSSVASFVSTADVTNINAAATGTYAGSVNGIALDGLAYANITGKELNINVASSNDAPINDVDYTATGLSLEAYRLPNASNGDMDRTLGFNTGADTKLTITAKTTGTKKAGGLWHSDGAATAIGISAQGGIINIGGDAVIDVQADGGAAVGALLNAHPMDGFDTSEYDEASNRWVWNTLGSSIEYGHDTTFRKNLTMTVHSNQSQAIGVALGGSCCGMDGENGGVDDRVYDQNVLTRLRTFGDFNLTVSNGSKDAIGVLFVGNDMGGLPMLKLLGKTTITADRAFVSQYWEEDDGRPTAGLGSDGEILVTKDDSGYAGDLTVNGTVDEYTGYFVQDAGTKVTLNTATWFAGMAKINGGTLVAKDSVYDTVNKPTVEAERRLYIMSDDADVTLKGINIGDLGTSSSGTGRKTFAKMYGGKLTVENLSIAEGGKFGVNAGTITVTGDSTIAGRLRPTTIEDPHGTYESGNNTDTQPQPDHSEATLITKGGFNVEKTGDIEVKNLTVDGGRFVNFGHINDHNHVDGDTLELKNGGTFITRSAAAHDGSVEHFKNLILGSATSWVNLLGADDSKTLAFESGVNVLDGGKFYYADSVDGTRTEYKSFEVGSTAADASTAVLTFNSGTYALDSLSIIANGQVGVESAASVNLGNVTLNGGTLTLEGNVSAKAMTLLTSNADLFKSGSLTAEWIRFGEDGSAEDLTFSLPQDYEVIIAGDNEADEDGQARVAAKVEGAGANVTVQSGTLDVLKRGSLTVNNLTVKNGAMLSAYLESVNANIFLEDGAELYVPVAPDNKTLAIDHGSLALRGNALLITSKDGSGHAGSIEETAPLSEVVVSGTGGFYVEGGSHSFDKITMNAGNATVKGANTKLTVSELVIGGTSFNVGSGDAATSGGTLEAGRISFADNTSGQLVLNGGTLSTTTDQLFKTSVVAEGQANAPGFITDPEIILNAARWNLTSGTILFNDAKYNDIYSLRANNLIDNKNVILNFTGDHVALNGQTDNTVDVGEIPDNENLIYSSVTGTVSAGASGDSAAIDRSIGVKDLAVDEGVNTVEVAAGKTVTLTGSSEGGDVITFKGDLAEQKTVDVKGGLVLGNQATDAGKVSQTVKLADKASLTVKNGTFEVTDVAAANGSKLAVEAGEATIGTLTASGTTTLDAGAGAKTTVSNLIVDATAEKAEHTLTGSVAVTGLKKEGTNDGVIYVGTTGDNGVRGDLKLEANVTSLAGLTFFLDPAYVNGKQITDGSRLVYQNNTIDGKIVVGENSYVVLGSGDDSALTAYFNEGKGLKWGNGEGAVLAAAYTDRPIEIDATGALFVSGEVTTLADANAADGTATFKENSAFVVDVTNAEANTVYLTAKSVSVENGAKAVLVGKLDSTKTYTLSSNEDANKVWGKNLFAGNALWDLSTDANGNIQATLQDAGLIYGDLMQGTEIATAGMKAGSDYVNNLLTDETADPAKLAQLAQRFDAAMNPAGALSVFTTAYDRSSDLRRTVREEAVKFEGNRLWVHLTGGKTELKGISTGSSQDIHTKTNAYGIVLGGEADVQGFTAGAAFTAGRGDTKNNAVSGKDEFDFYGLSLYGRTSFAGVDVLADVSGIWLKSDLTVGGVADVDTDTTTAVYSAGVQVQKTFDLAGIDVTPFVGASVYHVAMDGFQNGHGASIEDADATAVEFPVGATVAKAFETTGGSRLLRPSPSRLFRRSATRMLIRM